MTKPSGNDEDIWGAKAMGHVAKAAPIVERISQKRWRVNALFRKQPFRAFRLLCMLRGVNLVDATVVAQLVPNCFEAAHWLPIAKALGGPRLVSGWGDDPLVNLTTEGERRQRVAQIFLALGIPMDKRIWASILNSLLNANVRSTNVVTGPICDVRIFWTANPHKPAPENPW